MKDYLVVSHSKIKLNRSSKEVNHEKISNRDSEWSYLF